MRYETDFGKDFPTMFPGYQSIHGYPAVADVLAKQAANQCSLARTIRTDQSNPVTALDSELNAFQYGILPKSLDHFVKMDHQINPNWLGITIAVPTGLPAPTGACLVL